MKNSSTCFRFIRQAISIGVQNPLQITRNTKPTKQDDHQGGRIEARDGFSSGRWAGVFGSCSIIL